MILALSLVALIGCARAADQCQFCQRSECANLAFTIERKDGSTVRTCCPRCGLQALEPSAASETATRTGLSGRTASGAAAGTAAGSRTGGAAEQGKIPWDQVRSLTVRDFDTAQALPAEAALYVEGSDVTPCSMHSDAPRDERGCCLKPVYDRCLPSLLAFRTRERAEAFAKENGGAVRSFEELKAAAGSPASPPHAS